jgi:hypothetical protein
MAKASAFAIEAIVNGVLRPAPAVTTYVGD